MHQHYLFSNLDAILTSYQLSQSLARQDKTFQESSKYLKIFVYIFVM